MKKPRHISRIAKSFGISRSRARRALRTKCAFLSLALLTVLLTPRTEAAPKGKPAGDAPTVQVLTYASLLGRKSWGEWLKQNFEAKYACKIEASSAADGGQLLTRLELESQRGEPKFDVVLGLDTTWMRRLSGVLEDAPITDADRKAWFPAVREALGTFRAPLPFDYGLLTVLGRAQRPLGSWAELEALPHKSVILMDPRTSSPGWALLSGMRALFGKDWSLHWRAVRPRALTLASGWSVGYGLFLEKRAPWVWTYTTSQAYHVARGEKEFLAARLREGMPMQVEWAGLVKRSRPAGVRACAEQFMRMLISKDAQEALPERQWMFPVRKDVVLPPAFAGIPSALDAKTVPLPDLSREAGLELLRDWEALQ